MLLLILTSTPTLSHKTDSGWEYDSECCSDQDCAEVLSIEQLPNNGIKVTTKIGVGVMIPTTKMKISKDDKDHACIVFDKVICFYGVQRY